MRNYILLAKPYLVAVTIFVLLRFALEVAGVSQDITSEISLTRLSAVLPVFLGLRFARGELQGGFKTMLLTSFVYSFWGVFLRMIVTTLDVGLGLNTHYAFGPTGEPMPRGQHLGGYVISLVIFTLAASVICLITAKFKSCGWGLRTLLLAALLGLFILLFFIHRL